MSADITGIHRDDRFQIALQCPCRPRGGSAARWGIARCIWRAVHDGGVDDRLAGSWNLESLIVFRIIQGLAQRPGDGMVILYEVFPPAARFGVGLLLLAGSMDRQSVPRWEDIPSKYSWRAMFTCRCPAVSLTRQQSSCPKL
jgi:hypothetical protein